MNAFVSERKEFHNVSLKTRLLTGATTLAIVGGVVAFGAQSGQALARPHAKTVCTTVTGTSTGTVTISGCSGTANNGGASLPLNATSLAIGGTISWTNAQTTTFGAATLTNGNAHKCPGFVKVKKGVTPPPEPKEVKFTGVVTADSTGMKVPGKYKGDVCIDTSGNITARKPLKAN
jgi:hypothetical protein